MKKFVVIVGVDGSGKTTISNMLQMHLKDWHFTREPYASAYRDLIGITHDPIEKAYLFCADRAFHLRHELNKIKHQRNIICDRFSYCNIAYQSTEYEMLYKRDITEFLIRIQPDLPTVTHLIWLKCDPQVAYLRKKEQDAIFLQKVQKKYEEILPANKLVIDTTNMTPHETLEKVLHYLI